MARILIAGESWVTTSIHTKGFDSFTTVEYQEGIGHFRDAVEARGHQVDFMPNHVAASAFPYDAAGLDGYDAVVLSDIGSNTLLLPPAAFIGGQSLPNRLAILRDWVAAGGGLIMVGGYLSFQGFEAKANYRDTPIAEVLPVIMEPGDDRREAPESPVPVVVDPSHPVVAGLPPEWPAILGYHKVIAKSDAVVPVTVNRDPLVALGAYGRGRTVAYMTDVGPHWAPEAFLEWQGFGEFWDRVLEWIAVDSAVGADDERAGGHGGP